MVNITKSGETITFDNGNTMVHMPASSVIATSNKDADSVNIKLKASRKTIISFNYKDMNPTVESAEEAVNYIAGLI
mgnify:FL=1